jgi:hypothetical protein
VRLLAPVTLSVAALAITSGCGSSHARSVASRSATRHYSAQQVKIAFAAQGVRLHQIKDQRALGLVILRRGSESQFIEAWVSPPGMRVADQVVLNRFNGDTLSFRTRKHGNVTVFYAGSTAPMVKAALAGLH